MNNNLLLIEACRTGNLEQVKELLLLGADINFIYNYNYNPLVMACDSGQLEVVKYLLTSPDLKVHSQLDMDDHALERACANGHLEVVKYLLTSPDLKEWANLNPNSNNAIYEAFKTGYFDVIKFILSDPVKDTLSQEEYERIAEWVFDLSWNTPNFTMLEYILSNYSSDKINTNEALRQFSRFKNINGVKTLLTNTLFTSNSKFKRADNLLLAFTGACETNATEVISYLLEHTDLPTYIKTTFPNNAIRELCKWGYTDTLDFLLAGVLKNQPEAKFYETTWLTAIFERDPSVQTLEYLIVDYGLHLNESRENYLNINPHPLAQHAITMFKSRALHSKLNTGLPIKSDKSIQDKRKI